MGVGGVYTVREGGGRWVMGSMHGGHVGGRGFSFSREGVHGSLLGYSEGLGVAVVVLWALGDMGREGVWGGSKRLVMTWQLGMHVWTRRHPRPAHMLCAGSR